MYWTLGPDAPLSSAAIIWRGAATPGPGGVARCSLPHSIPHRPCSGGRPRLMSSSSIASPPPPTPPGPPPGRPMTPLTPAPAPAAGPAAPASRWPWSRLVRVRDAAAAGEDGRSRLPSSAAAGATRIDMAHASKVPSNALCAGGIMGPLCPACTPRVSWTMPSVSSRTGISLSKGLPGLPWWNRSEAER